MKKNCNISVNSPAPSKGKAQSIPDVKKQPLKPLTTKQVPTDTKRIPAPARPTVAPQKVPPTEVSPAKKASAPIQKTTPATRPPPQRGPATAPGSPQPVRPMPIPAKSKNLVTKRTIPVRAKAGPQVTPSSFRPAAVPAKPTAAPAKPVAAPAKRVPATPRQAAKPNPARAASAGVPNKTTTPSTGKLNKEQPPEETNRIDGGNDGTTQPPKKSSNKISWKKVGVNVLRFYFGFCLS